MTTPPEAAPMREDVTRFEVGPLTMREVFQQAGLENLSDMQAVLNAVEASIQRAHTARPDAGDEDVERDETCPACEGKTMGPGEFCIAGCRDGKVRWTTANVLRNVLPWLTSAERELKEARAALAEATGLPSALAAMREGVDRGMVDRTEVQAVWRCAIGDMVGAMDILKKQWLQSKRKAERQAGEVLSGVLDLIWAYRDPAPSSYEDTNENGKTLADRVRAALSAKRG